MSDPAAAPCELYLVTPPALDPEAFRDTLAAALDAGEVAAVQLRLKDADEGEVRRAIDVLRPVAQSRGVAFLLNDRPDLAAATGLPPGLPVVAGAGDNAAVGVALGLRSARPGVGGLSLGTGGVLFAPEPAPTPEPEGRVGVACQIPERRAEVVQLFGQASEPLHLRPAPQVRFRCFSQS